MTALHSRWEELVGPVAALRCRPKGIEGACLIVEVDQGAWASQLRWQSADILRRAATVLGEGLVERVEVRVRAP